VRFAKETYLIFMNFPRWSGVWIVHDRIGKKPTLNEKRDRTIAIVDDDAAAREATDSLLRSLGYCTELFASAEEFLASEGVRTSACVISDVRMPGMSGVELQQRLIESLAEVPMIFVTAFAEDHVRQRVLAAGAHGYLTKPFSPHRLVSCLAEAMKS
jgi:FixJ family two-component response regulator